MNNLATLCRHPAVKERGGSKVSNWEVCVEQGERREWQQCLRWRHLPSESDLSLQPMMSYSMSANPLQELQKRRSKLRKGWKSAKLRGLRRGRTRPGGDASRRTETSRPVTCHTRLMAGPRNLADSALCLRPIKWLKGASNTQTRGRVSSAGELPVICYNFQRQTWQDGITLPLRSHSFTNAVKCRYKSSAQMYLICGFWGATTSSDMGSFIGSKTNQHNNRSCCWPKPRVEA